MLLLDLLKLLTFLEKSEVWLCQNGTKLDYFTFGLLKTLGKDDKQLNNFLEADFTIQL